MRRIWARRGLAGALATLAFLAACGGGDDSEEASSGNREGNGESTTTAAESTTTEQPTLTTVAGEGPAEWLEVVNDTQIRLAELGLNPDPERVRDVVAEECACYERHFNTTNAIADEGQRIVGDPTHVLFVRVEQEYEDGSVRLTVQGQPGAGQFVDANGEVLEEFDVGDPSCFSLLVKPDGPEGAYRIHDELQLEGNSCRGEG